jgi:hypothetical protein
LLPEEEGLPLAFSVTSGPEDAQNVNHLIVKHKAKAVRIAFIA